MSTHDTPAMFGDHLEICVAAHGLLDSLDAIELDALDRGELAELHADICVLLASVQRRAGAVEVEAFSRINRDQLALFAMTAGGRR